ncbi:MAG TPA: hypothetical protein PLO47_04960 [Bacillota bacterium]|nr:hypothetical protein [Bacillota bacterium]
MSDYKIYRMSKKEKLSYYASACALLGFLGFLFYRSLVMSALVALAALPLEKIMSERLRLRRLEKLSEGFRDALYSISGSVAAGRQLPQAIGEAAKAAELSYGADSDIAFELKSVYDAYEQTHGNVEEMLGDLAKRSGLAEIEQFAQSCAVCRRCGGDMEAVSLKGAALLLDRMEFERELKGIMIQKRSDIALLTSMPIIILLLLNLTSFGYLAPLYSGLGGRLIMSLCLAAMLGALLWSLKITDIKL